MQNCKCGVAAADLDNRRYHGLAHKHWEFGPALSKSLPVQDMLIVFESRKSPKEARLTAYRMARIARRQGGYDFVSFAEPPHRSSPYSSDNGLNAVAYLPIRDGRVVGYVVVRPRVAGIHLYKNGNLLISPGQRIEYETLSTPRPCVDLLFTCFAYRRQGIVRTAIERIVADNQLQSPADLLWQTPFTDDGRETVVSLCNGNVWAG